jgi:hypothetical protein
MYQSCLSDFTGREILAEVPLCIRYQPPEW